MTYLGSKVLVKELKLNSELQAFRASQYICVWSHIQFLSLERTPRVNKLVSSASVISVQNISRYDSFSKCGIV